MVSMLLRKGTLFTIKIKKMPSFDTKQYKQNKRGAHIEVTNS